MFRRPESRLVGDGEARRLTSLADCGLMFRRGRLPISFAFAFRCLGWLSAGTVLVSLDTISGLDAPLDIDRHDSQPKCLRTEMDRPKQLSCHPKIVGR
jgi:hypothetical protein